MEPKWLLQTTSIAQLLSAQRTFHNSARPPATHLGGCAYGRFLHGRNRCVRVNASPLGPFKILLAACARRNVA